MVSLGAKIRAKIRKDPNLPRLGRGIKLGLRGLRAGAGTYFSDKVPVFQWISVYSPKWIIDDALAGSSVGLLLLPQALMYSMVAGVPIQQALFASWLPGLIYAFMGTSRDISLGPTFSSALFTGIVVKDLGIFGVPAPIAVSAVSFSLGLWSMAFGMLKLGFLFDFISLPMSLGFAMGTALVVSNSQIPAILGLNGITIIFSEMMPQIIKQIKETRPLTVFIAFVSIVILTATTYVASKWGKKNGYIRFWTNSRNLVVLGLFTGMSYYVNNGLQFPMFSVLGPVNATIPAPSLPKGRLVSQLVMAMFSLMTSTALEHVTLAKAFAYKNGYTIDASQEVFSIGVANIVNSLFGGLPVGGGDMARASVNATSGVKSPLSGLFTSFTVILGMYALGPSLTFMPLATVAAVIAVTVLDQQPAQALMGKYWKTSFVDFVTLFLAFTMTFMGSAAVGIGMAFCFAAFYTLMRVMFSRPGSLVSIDLESKYTNDTPPWWAKEDRVPPGSQVIRLETDAIWLNAERLKRHIMDTVYTYQSGVPRGKSAAKRRVWNYRRDKHIAKLRRKARVNDTDTFIPRLRVVILDLTSTSFIDSCAIQILEEIKLELRAYAGEGVEFRFVGMNTNVRRRFARAGWKIVSPNGNHQEPVIGLALGGEEMESEKEKEDDRVKDLWFEFLPHAIQHISPTGPEGYDFEEVSVRVNMKKF
ncbi:uncharacterized protein L3040_001895 [Drepanopeziza brunnea f. sp. 'multigermtubi']|nr:hypothetical protein L3040_001895 [Drepanopeziza brunnea f. sp. 'multigermtubi']